jgi:hypothetical protein
VGGAVTTSRHPLMSIMSIMSAVAPDIDANTCLPIDRFTWLIEDS